MAIGIHGQHGQLVLLLVEVAINLERVSVPTLHPNSMATFALSMDHLKERTQTATQEHAVSVLTKSFIAFINIYMKNFIIQLI